MDSPLRFAICASLIGFGTIIAGGGLALLPHAVETLATVRAEKSEQFAPPSLNATGPKPEVAAQANAIPAEARSASEPVAVQPSAEIQQAAGVLPEPVRQSEINEPPHDTTAKRLATEQRQAVVPTVQKQVRAPAPKKPIRRVQDAKASTREALKTVRKFGDDRRDISANAYAGHGTRPPMDIRPTSIQDVYYYSVSR